MTHERRTGNIKRNQERINTIRMREKSRRQRKTEVEEAVAAAAESAFRLLSAVISRES